MNTLWGSRTLIKLYPDIAMCRSEEEWLYINKEMDIPYWQIGKFPKGVTQARTSNFTKPNGDSACVVCIDKEHFKDREHPALCLLVHEAVHVFQHHCECIGEDKPSAEFQAYAIQNIFDELTRLYTAEFVVPS